MKEVTYAPIGTIRSPFKTLRGMPIQAEGARGVAGEVEIEEKYVPGLKDLEGFSHIILIYHFHRSRSCVLEVKPFLDDSSHGVFATRAPSRPNPIGLSIVRLVRVERNVLHIEDVDILDETPLLDLKPYVPAFDVRTADRIGWLAGKADGAGLVKADGRFE